VGESTILWLGRPPRLAHTHSLMFYDLCSDCVRKNDILDIFSNDSKIIRVKFMSFGEYIVMPIEVDYQSIVILSNLRIGSIKVHLSKYISTICFINSYIGNLDISQATRT
jgi:hypothetical protein